MRAFRTLRHAERHGLADLDGNGVEITSEDEDILVGLPINSLAGGGGDMPPTFPLIHALQLADENLPLVRHRCLIWQWRRWWLHHRHVAAPRRRQRRRRRRCHGPPHHRVERIHEGWRYHTSPWRHRWHTHGHVHRRLIHGWRVHEPDLRRDRTLVVPCGPELHPHTGLHGHALHQPTGQKHILAEDLRCGCACNETVPLLPIEALDLTKKGGAPPAGCIGGSLTQDLDIGCLRAFVAFLHGEGHLVPWLDGLAP
mmetsp:Transcript_92836/g.267037  ORF Transcript_92836/g.267037 Transcript_92836/m.267037 type:complete len:255 (+) Transcript_92836:370-1134(+)